MFVHLNDLRRPIPRLDAPTVKFLMWYGYVLSNLDFIDHAATPTVMR
jgi:hypothetical protein